MRRPRALCATHPEPDLWFSGSKSQERAALICRRCPLRPACLAHAVERPEVWGVWGGTTEEQRRALVEGTGRRFVEPAERATPVLRRDRDGDLVAVR